MPKPRLRYHDTIIGFVLYQFNVDVLLWIFSPCDNGLLDWNVRPLTPYVLPGQRSLSLNCLLPLPPPGLQGGLTCAAYRSIDRITVSRHVATIPLSQSSGAVSHARAVVARESSNTRNCNRDKLVGPDGYGLKCSAHSNHGSQERQNLMLISSRRHERGRGSLTLHQMASKLKADSSNEKDSPPWSGSKGLRSTAACV